MTLHILRGPRVYVVFVKRCDSVWTVEVRAVCTLNIWLGYAFAVRRAAYLGNRLLEGFKAVWIWLELVIAQRAMFERIEVQQWLDWAWFAQPQ